MSLVLRILHGAFRSSYECVLYGMAFLLGKGWMVAKFAPVPVQSDVTDPGGSYTGLKKWPENSIPGIKWHVLSVDETQE